MVQVVFLCIAVLMQVKILLDYFKTELRWLVSAGSLALNSSTLLQHVPYISLIVLEKL